MVGEQVAFAASWALVGWALGLVLNRLIYQLPRDAPLRATPACSACGRAIPPLGTPLGQTCRGCGSSLGYDRIEWVLVGLFLLLALYHGRSSATVIYSLYAAALAVIAAIDARHRYVYTIVSYPAALAALALSPGLPGSSLTATLLGLAVGGGVFLVVYLGGRVLYRGIEPMGTGDVTIAAMIGAMVGFPRVFGALLIGSIVSALLGVAIMIAQRQGRRTFVPYGPGLCAGAVATFFMAP